jgi:hypothetical protein
MLGKTTADDPSIVRAERSRGYLRLGAVEEQEGNFQPALDCYQTAMESDPTSEAQQKIEALRMRMTKTGEGTSPSK